MIGTIQAYRCTSCEALFEEPAGSVYECSRCGGTFGEDDAEDRRCPECHIFIAKIAEESCPECSEPDPEAVTAWRGADGQLYESEAAESEWTAAAPERAKRKAESEAHWKKYRAEEAAKNLAENAVLAPKIRRALEILGGRMPTLEESLTWELGNIDRHPEDRAGLVAMLYFYELAAVFAPEMSEELAVARDYLHRTDEERTAAEEKIRPLILEALGRAPFYDRLRNHWFTAGSGVGVPVAEAIDALLGATEEDR